MGGFLDRVRQLLPGAVPDARQGPAARPIAFAFLQAQMARAAEGPEAEVGRGVVGVLSYLSYRDPAVADAAAEWIDRFVRQLPPDRLPALDRQLREVRDFRWPDVLPHEVSRLARGSAAILGILSFHPSGYVRESAVGTLAKCSDGTEVPFLFLRLNDWVPQVRDAAVAAVRPRLLETSGPEFIALLPLVRALEQQGRADHGPILLAVRQILSKPAFRASMLRAVEAARPGLARHYFLYLSELPETDPEELVFAGLKSSDPTVRLGAAKLGRLRLRGRALERLVERCRADRFMPVRREATLACVEGLPERAPAATRSALLDPHPSLRELARFHLRDAGVDFAQVYRVELAAQPVGPRLQAAIGGLGETGTGSDARTLLPFLRHPIARVRRRAVLAVARLDAESHWEALLEAAGDGSRAVAGAAHDVLAKQVQWIGPGRLASAFNRAATPAAKTAVLLLAGGLSPWDRAPLLIHALNAGESVAKRALNTLRLDSCGGRFSPLAGARQVGALREALMSSAAAHLPPEIASELHGAIRRWDETQH